MPRQRTYDDGRGPGRPYITETKETHWHELAQALVSAPSINEAARRCHLNPNTVHRTFLHDPEFVAYVEELKRIAVGQAILKAQMELPNSIDRMISRGKNEGGQVPHATQQKADEVLKDFAMEMAQKQEALRQEEEMIARIEEEIRGLEDRTGRPAICAAEIAGCEDETASSAAEAVGRVEGEGEIAEQLTLPLVWGEVLE